MEQLPARRHCRHPHLALPTLVLLVPLLASGLKVQPRSKPSGDYDCYSGYERKLLLRFHQCTPEMAASTLASTTNRSCLCLGAMGELLEPEPAQGCCTSAPVVCEPEVGHRLLESYGKKVSLISNDTGAFYRARSGTMEPYEMPNTSTPTLFGADDFYSRWRDLESEEKRVQQLVQRSRGIAKRESVGKSYQKHDIWAVRFTGPGYSKGGKKILLTYQLHAREWIAGMAGIYVIDQLVNRTNHEPEWLNGMEIVVVPMSNPDGFLYSGHHDRMWRKNRHIYDNSVNCQGVDLNRNFPTDWNGKSSVSSSRCSDIYVGEKAASEPETQAIKRVVDESKLTLHIDHHSYSEIFLAPWSYKTEPHPDRKKINDLMKRMKHTIFQRSGRQYDIGGSELLYQASGVCPDYSTSQGAWGITMELSPKMDFYGGGFMLPARDILPTVMDAWEVVVAAVDYVKGHKAS